MAWFAVVVAIISFALHFLWLRAVVEIERELNTLSERVGNLEECFARMTANTEGKKS